MANARVINPANGAPKNNGTFTWTMGTLFYIKSKVIVGYTPGVDDIYQGGNNGNGFPHAVLTDTAVHHPGGNTLCYTRPKYTKTNVPNPPWFTINTDITTFTSTNAYP